VINVFCLGPKLLSFFLVDDEMQGQR